MGNNSTKLPNKKFKKKPKTKKPLCCLCASHSLTNSLSSSSCSIEGKYFPTLDRIRSKNNHPLASIENINVSDRKRTVYFPSIKISEKPLHTATNINQWIDSLPIVDAAPLESVPKNNLINEHEELARILSIKSNLIFSNLIKHFQLNFYFEDYTNRLKNSKIDQTFKTHFSSSTIISPSNRHNQSFIDDLNVFIVSPPESILPTLLKNTNSSYLIHEQLRSKCYVIPLSSCQIEPNDDEYREKSIPIDRTHVVITLENSSTLPTSKTQVENEPSCLFTSNDSFQTGLIRINQENIPKDFLPFLSYHAQENISYLSSNLIQQWFHTLILVNQTCTIAQRFLTGNERHCTFLLKEQIKNQSNKEK